MEIDESWERVVMLSDGTAVRLALITPEDAPLIERGFEALSDDTKYRRFLAAKRSLSDWELDYLSNVDQIDHVAIGATIPAELTDGGQREGIGVARFIRLTENDAEAEAPLASKSGVAEAAITVVDAYQNLGLGTHLLEWLVRAADERGIEAFQCTLLARNSPVQRLLDMAPDTRVVSRDGAVLTVEVDLPETDAKEGGAGDVLNLVGRGDASLAGGDEADDD